MRVKGLRPPFRVASIAQVRATGAVFVGSRIGVLPDRFRFSRPGAPGVSPSAGLRLWTDADGIWTVDGQEVLRDGRTGLHAAGAPHRSRPRSFDREGSLWLGTDAGGLHRLKPALFTTYSVPEGVGHANVYSTYVDRSGAVWLGTWGKGRAASTRHTGRDNVSRRSGDSASVNSFYEDAGGGDVGRDGRGEGGIYRLHASRHDMSRRGSARAARAARCSRSMADADGRVWAGAAGLLFRYDGASWTSFPPSSGAPEATVRAFASTRDGALWMGTNGGGLARYREGAFTRVTHADGLPSDLIRSLYQDADGWLWVGTEGRGLARLDPRAWGNGRRTTKPAIVRIGAEGRALR